MMRRTEAKLLAALLCWLPGTELLAQTPDLEAHAIQRAIDELRLEEAAEAVEQLARAQPETPETLYLKGLMAFHQGQYGQADAYMQRATAKRSDVPESWIELSKLVADTKNATAHFASQSSSDGRYRVSYEPGRDEILVPYVFEALQAADKTLGEVLGVRLAGPIRVEIFPSAHLLAQVSTLTMEEIHRTGTIALCKWNRLMVTSPWALRYGYPWMDTLTHEYAHLLLSRSSRNRAPVWLQEGVAKFLERRWRTYDSAFRLEPDAKALLHKAVRANTLIPFSKLHPSVARLPSQRDAALAFAQVATFIARFLDDHGASGLRRVVAAVARGRDAQEAFEAAAGKPWSDLLNAWKAWLLREAAEDRDEDPPPWLEMAFRDQAPLELPAATAQSRKFVRLGDLLWSRKRALAASKEYEKAHRAAPQDPLIASRLIQTSLEAGRTELAMHTAQGVLESYPDHAPAHAALAQAWLAQGSRYKASRSAREAIRVNPFDPAPHCTLAEASDADHEQQREQHMCNRLTRNLE